MTAADSRDVARLFGDLMPWSIFSKAHVRFNARFIRWIQQQDQAEVWTAISPEGKVVGICGAAMDKPRVYGDVVRKHFVRISISTLANLWRPGVLTWLLRAVRDRLRPSAPARERSVPRPNAELVFIAVAEEAKGTGLARRLQLVMEAQFREWGLRGPYVILVLDKNERAQAFYRRQGAYFVAKVPTRGQLICEYHKELSPPDEKSDTPV